VWLVPCPLASFPLYNFPRFSSSLLSFFLFSFFPPFFFLALYLSFSFSLPLFLPSFLSLSFYFSLPLSLPSFLSFLSFSFSFFAFFSILFFFSLPFFLFLPFPLSCFPLSPSLCQDYDNTDCKCTWKEAKLYNSKVVKILFNENYVGIIMTHYMESHCLS
jgi:hypothetical protein